LTDVEVYLREGSIAFEAALERYLPQGDDLVSQAMCYSLAGGGKRIRPALLSAFCALFNGEPEQAQAFAAAIEMVHSYSLIHDDLPCMDDDDYRRGRLSCHRKFGEQAALLAGDALLTQAFAVLAGADFTPELRIRAVDVLSKAAGQAGMAGGQWLDLSYETKAIKRAQLEDMNRRKTGALLCAACELGCLAAAANEEQTAAALRYADSLGLLFQLTDDILDVTGDRAKLGKSAGKDAAAGKSTWVSLLGLERARMVAQEYAALARHAIAPYAGADDFLYCLPGWLVEREY